MRNCTSLKMEELWNIILQKTIQQHGLYFLYSSILQLFRNFIATQISEWWSNLSLNEVFCFDKWCHYKIN